MREKIGKYLGIKGFQKLFANIPGMTILFTIENGYINVIVLADADGEQAVTPDSVREFLSKSDWKAPGGETIDVHTLLVVISSDVEKAREIGEGHPTCWYLDTSEQEIVIDPDKPEDFYGMKEIIRQAIAQTEEELESALTKEEGLPEGYPRETEKRRPFSHLSFVNYGLLIINFVMFILCIFAGDLIYAKGALNPEMLMRGSCYYQLFTCMFLHCDVYHLSGNMIYLLACGDMAEQELGHFKFLVLYILSGLVADFVSLGFSWAMQDFTPSLGASGAIFGITGALLWVVLRNRGRHKTITVSKMIFLIIYSLYMGFYSNNVDNAAHVGGLIGGFLIAIILYKKKETKNAA